MPGEKIKPGDDFFKQKTDPLDRVKSDKKPLIKELIYEVDSLFSCIENN